MVDAIPGSPPFIVIFFIAALFFSGLTAIPLQPELDFLVHFFAQGHPPTALGSWLLQVQSAIQGWRSISRCGDSARGAALMRTVSPSLSTSIVSVSE